MALKNSVDVFLIQDPPKDAKTTGGRSFRAFYRKGQIHGWQFKLNG